MKQRAAIFFWVILLLVGLNLVTPDPVEVTPAPSQDSAVALIDSDDVDNPDHSHTFDLLAHVELSLLPLGILFTGPAPYERLQPPTQSTAPKFLLLSLRTPRSPTTN